jgi:hypothetical protein
MSVHGDLTADGVGRVSPEGVARVLASVAELQCECRPGTERELVRLTAMEPDQVRQALALLTARGAVAGAEAGGVVQYRLSDRRLPVPAQLPG